MENLEMNYKRNRNAYNRLQMYPFKKAFLISLMKCNIFQ